MKQFEISVKILVSVPDDNSLGMSADQWAGKVAGEYAMMALKYKSISADEILEYTVKETENV